jgi:hypothetical protein
LLLPASVCQQRYTLYDEVWAVRSGDLGAAIVPLAAAVWLFGGGLLRLIGMGRKPLR